MRRNQTSVHHWRYDNGWRDVPQVFRNKDPSLPEQEFDAGTIGWHCWVYPADDSDFELWMDENMPSADYSHKFNSGDPMYLVHIHDDNEASLFKLKWM